MLRVWIKLNWWPDTELFLSCHKCQFQFSCLSNWYHKFIFAIICATFR